MLEAGQRVEGYEIEAVVGQGGMATVFRVRDRDTGQVHALKVLTMRHPEVIERFRREAVTQASLSHPGIVAVQSQIELDGEHALLMDYVDGVALDEWVQRHPDMPAAARDDLATQIITAVGYAHARGVVHRDLKPANVLINEAGGLLVARITDFGLAKVHASAPSATRSGVALGTPRYMSPEQIRDAKSVDHRADIFSLGALLYELYTGRPAFQRGALLEIFQAVVDGDYEDPTGQVPPRVAMAIRGALQADREQRIPDCEALLAVLLGQDDSLMNGTLDIDGDEVPTQLAPARAAPQRRAGGWVWAWAFALALVCLGWLAAGAVAGAVVVGAAALPAELPEQVRPVRPEPSPRPYPRKRRGRR